MVRWTSFSSTQNHCYDVLPYVGTGNIEPNEYELNSETVAKALLPLICFVHMFGHSNEKSNQHHMVTKQMMIIIWELIRDANLAPVSFTLNLASTLIESETLGGGPQKSLKSFKWFWVSQNMRITAINNVIFLLQIL